MLLSFLPHTPWQDRAPLFPEVPDNPNIGSLFNEYLKNNNPASEAPLTDEQVGVMTRFVLQARFLLQIPQVVRTVFIKAMHDVFQIKSSIPPVQMQDDMRKAINEQVKEAQDEVKKPAKGKGKGGKKKGTDAKAKEPRSATARKRKQDEQAPPGSRANEDSTLLGNFLV